MEQPQPPLSCALSDGEGVPVLVAPATVFPEPPASAVPAVEAEPPAGIPGNAPVPVVTLVDPAFAVLVVLAAPPATRLLLAPPAVLNPAPP